MSLQPIDIEVVLLKRYILLAVFLMLAMPPRLASCEGFSFDKTYEDWGEFSLGFLSGILTHELGHYIVALSKGYKVSHDGLSIVYPGAILSDSNRLKLASAGFQAQWLLSEALLRDKYGKEMKEPLGNFSTGAISSHLGISLAYLTILKNHKQGDIAGIAASTGLTNTQASLIFAIPAVLDAWRLFGTEVPDWVPQVSLLTKGVGIVRIWSY